MAAAHHHLLLLLLLLFFNHPVPFPALADFPLPFLWPLPRHFTSGNLTLSLDPALSFRASGPAAASPILLQAFRRCQEVIFRDRSRLLKRAPADYDVAAVNVVVDSADETLQLGVDESYSLFVSNSDGHSILGAATIEVGC